MPKKILGNITHVFHDWDGVYTNYLDINAFWKMAATLAVEASIFNCSKKAEETVRNLWIVAKESGKPYETTYDLLNQEFNIPLSYCIKRMHEILFAEHQESFQVIEGVAELMGQLTHLEHIILTHSNRYWVDRWTTKAGTKGYYNHVVCNVHEGLGRKNIDLHLYSSLEERFGVKPESCLLIDDSLVNLKKAKEAGWVTIWRKPNDDTIAPDYIDISYTCAKGFLQDLITHT